MILFLTGPTGSGKTDTSWGLITALDNLVFLDCDWFASRSNFSWKNAGDVDSVFRALLSQISFHRSERRKQFVVTLTLEMAVMFFERRDEFKSHGLPLYAFRLFCRPEIIQERVRRRDRNQMEEELVNAISGLAEFDRLFPDETLFQRIDTSDLPSEAVVRQILQRLRADNSHEDFSISQPC